MIRTSWPSGDAASDLDAAVVAGILDRDTSLKLAAFLQSRGTVPEVPLNADDEQLRLITGFNDIFVTIGLALFLGALSYLLAGVGTAVSAAAAAMTAWLLAEFFTRRRRMALPSIALLLVFVGSIFLSFYAVLDVNGTRVSIMRVLDNSSAALMLSALAAAVAAAAHWVRFHVPITIAAGFGAVAILIIAVISYLVPGLVRAYPAIVFVPIGLAAFALAMRFDMSDRQRLTRRTDIAFWLHLLAAPIIVHPLILSLGIGSGQGLAAALSIFAVFAALCLVALVIDRRAVLVSSLGYLAYAAFSVVEASGWASSSAFGVLLVGAIVLLLSAAWRPLRKIVLSLMPDAITSRVPAVNKAS